MKEKGCPQRKVCKEDCTQCPFGVTIKDMRVTIQLLKTENRRLNAKLKKYESLGTYKQLDDALFDASI